MVVATLLGTLFFQANDANHGTELWKSDGTEAGTTMFMDINTVPYYGSNPVHATKRTQPTCRAFSHTWSCTACARRCPPQDNFVIFDNKLFFSAEDDANGRELWSTDGTVGGTAIVKDINPGAAYDSNPVLAPHVHALAASAKPSPSLPVLLTVRASCGRARAS